MVLESAKLMSFMLCLLLLLAAFHAAFLAPGDDFQLKILEALGWLVPAGLSSLSCGLFYCADWTLHKRARSLTEALPVQLFCWATGGMAVLFVVTWYVETHFILYKDARF